MALCGSTSGRTGPARAGPRGGERRRRGEGEREGGERLRLLAEYAEYGSGGGGVGRRTAD